MVTCQSSELGWEVTVELPADFLSLGRGSVNVTHVLCQSSSSYPCLGNRRNGCRFSCLSDAEVLLILVGRKNKSHRCG